MPSVRQHCVGVCIDNVLSYYLTMSNLSKHENLAKSNDGFPKKEQTSRKPYFGGKLNNNLDTQSYT